MTERQSMTRLRTVRGAGRAAREHAGRPAPGWPAVILRMVGSGLLIATAAIHLDFYLTGYRTIPTIGWLFLLQMIAAFGLGLAVRAIPPAGGRGGSRLRPRYPRGLSPVGLDRAVQVQGGPHERRHRRRPGGGSRVRGTGRTRACSRPGEGRSRPRGSGPWEEALADVLWVRSPAMAEPLSLLLARTAVGAFRTVLTSGSPPPALHSQPS
jgi:hypothetical protein